MPILFSRPFEVTEELLFRGKQIQFARKYAWQLLLASGAGLLGVRMVMGEDPSLNWTDLLQIALLYGLLCLVWIVGVKFIWVPMRFRKLSKDRKLRFLFQLKDNLVLLSYLDTAQEYTFPRSKIRVSTSASRYVFNLGRVGLVPLAISIERAVLTPDQIETVDRWIANCS